MTKDEFEKFWAENYPETLPINYLFKHNLKSRWLRIHSLPESKRYADSENEWTILLERQNTVLNDLIAENSAIILVTGSYGFEEETSETLLLKELGELDFTSLNRINQHEHLKDSYSEGTFFTPYFAVTVYAKHKFDAILKKIADDEIRLFFIGEDCLIAPYDGGMDLIFKDESTTEFYRSKYKIWLSEREDGL
jgi:hypothetical protein